MVTFKVPSPTPSATTDESDSGDSHHGLFSDGSPPNSLFSAGSPPPPSSLSEEEKRQITASLRAHDNIFDFYGGDRSDLEDPEYRYGTSPPYSPRFGDIKTLEQLIREKRKPPGIPTSKAHPGLPEPLVWHVMLSMLRALMYLHDGQRVHPKKEPPIDGWNPIIHNDINPADIFFTHPTARQSQDLALRYGQCQLGNFERCVLLQSVVEPLDLVDHNDKVLDYDAIDELEDALEHLYHAGEKTGYEAPELLDPECEAHEFAGPHSDLWSLGAVLVTAMTGVHFWDFIMQLMFEDQANSIPHPESWSSARLVESWRSELPDDRHLWFRKIADSGQIQQALPPLYSKNLRMHIEVLLSLKPYTRSTAKKNLPLAEKHFDIWKKKRGGLKDFETRDESGDSDDGEDDDEEDSDEDLDGEDVDDDGPDYMKRLERAHRCAVAETDQAIKEANEAAEASKKHRSRLVHQL